MTKKFVSNDDYKQITIFENLLKNIKKSFDIHETTYISLENRNFKK